MKTKISFIFIFVLVFSANLLAQKEEVVTGKNPVIVIPGIMGSKLVNTKTNEQVWVKLKKAKYDDLSLPISANLKGNRDNLKATDIVDRYKIVKFLPGISVYSDLTNFLEKKAGYRLGNWDNPSAKDFQDTYYVFAYDWRRDNVESAHLLLQKLERLRLKLKKPNLKFDIVAHSMGGLITRYAAMYGMSDLSERPAANWSGAKYFDKVFLLGTPNEGSMNALETLNEGYSIDTPIAGRMRPGYLNREVAFTIPSIYQLLPHGKSARFFDENLKPIELNIYDPANWKKYGWMVTTDPKFVSKMNKTQKAAAERYFSVVLRRAQLFHQALDVKTTVPKTLGMYLYGSDCKDTLNGAVVYYDAEKATWKTLTDGNSFKTTKGEKVNGKDVKQLIYSKGDGTVSFNSLNAEDIAVWNGQGLFFEKLPSPNQTTVCEEHTSIPSNKQIQDALIATITQSVMNKKLD